MGSKSQKSQASSDYHGAIQAVQPTAGETALDADATSTINWLHGGDYRSRPKNIFFNFADPAERRRHRELVSNAGAQGTTALGHGSSTALALDKQNRDDENARDDSASYEQDVSQAGQRAAGVIGNMAQLNNARRLGVLGATASVYNNSINQPSFWDKLLRSMQQGAQTAAMAGA